MKKLMMVLALGLSVSACQHYGHHGHGGKDCCSKDGAKQECSMDKKAGCGTDCKCGEKKDSK